MVLRPLRETAPLCMSPSHMARVTLLHGRNAYLLSKCSTWKSHVHLGWRRLGHSSATPSALSGTGHSSAAGVNSLVSGQQYDVLLAYLDQVLEFNKHTNLTAITDRDEAVERHIHDCLALLPVLDKHAKTTAGRSLRLIDVGSGGGFPGVVLAIARPQWQVWLLDSLRKRCDFVQGAVAGLGISNAKTLWGRAETLGQDAEHREVYDMAVARAVADMRILSELCLPFVRTGGRFVAAKGPDPSRELQLSINAFELLGGSLLGVEEVDSMSESGRPRTAVVVQKIMDTPRKYPRREGLPSKRPLKNP